MAFSVLHHGAVDGVTGSCHELRAEGGPGLLVDCGLFQGAEVSKGGADFEHLQVEFPVEHLRAMVLTHVHIDHCGRLPYLLAAGFDGPIFCSQPSAVLLPLVLEDALRIGFTRDARLVRRVLALVEQRLVPLAYGAAHTHDLGDGVRLEVELQRAGHILGSAWAQCRMSRGGDSLDVIFSGDLGAVPAPLLHPPAQPQRADVVVLESTYGDREHEDRSTRRARLQAVIERALADRGAVLVPAFSIGRTQDLLYEIEETIHDIGGDWAGLEIIVDSPLASRFTDAYRRLSGFWDQEAQQRRAAGRHPLAFEQLTTIDGHDDHQRAVAYLQRTARPCVVIAGSGMCSGGRIMNYLKALVGDPRTDVLFVGYQAQGTPGRDIQRYGPRGGWVELDGERHDIRAGVHTLGGYSAHADRTGLLRFVADMREPPRQVRLVHGDDDAKRALREALLALDAPGMEVVIP